MSDTITKDMVVAFEYVLTLDNGDEIDHSEEGESMKYLHGHQNIVPGLEREMEGMGVGDSKDVKVAPQDGYGEYDPDDVTEQPEDEFPPEIDVQPGVMLEMQDPDIPDEIAVAVVKQIEDGMVTLDFNHPLAGQTLNFAVKVVGVRPATSEELSHGHAHDAHGQH